MSVILTTALQSHKFANPAILIQTQPEQAEKLGVKLPPALIQTGLTQGADAFGVTFTVALILIAVCFIPALMLPRHKAPATEEAPAAVLAH